MEREAAAVLRDALALPPEVRAALIDSLISSLDQAVDAAALEEAEAVTDWYRRSVRAAEMFLDELDRATERLGDHLGQFPEFADLTFGGHFPVSPLCPGLDQKSLIGRWPMTRAQLPGPRPPPAAGAGSAVTQLSDRNCGAGKPSVL